MDDQRAAHPLSTAEAGDLATSANAHTVTPGAEPGTIQHLNLIEPGAAVSVNWSVADANTWAAEAARLQSAGEWGCCNCSSKTCSGACADAAAWRVKWMQERKAAESAKATKCCAGVDAPGVGLVHSPGCPREGSPVRSGREYVGGEVPEPLHGLLAGVDHDRHLDGETRDRLLCQLLFAARDLAQSWIEQKDSGEPYACLECGTIEFEGNIAHEQTCRVGSVMHVLADLCQAGVSTTTKTVRKEVALKPERETGAGDGIRPRGLAELVCLACGTRGSDGNWKLLGSVKAGLVNLSTLQLHECVCSRVGKSGDRINDIYAHDCMAAARESDAAAVVENSPAIRATEAAMPAAIDLLCLECGERGGHWNRRGDDDSSRVLMKNERACEDAAGTGRYIWQHDCTVAKGGAR